MKCEIDKIGTKRWYDESNELHRAVGPAVEYVDGTMEWWVHGLLHKENGPAVVSTSGPDSGTKEWWVNGLLHREDGPAIVWGDGTLDWYLKGESFDFNEWCNESNKTEKEIIFLVLKYEI
jgi:hypothetical protein